VFKPNFFYYLSNLFDLIFPSTQLNKFYNYCYFDQVGSKQFFFKKKEIEKKERKAKYKTKHTHLEELGV
jgi:hypothetical protein